jgi:hypothetical protein
LESFDAAFFSLRRQASFGTEPMDRINGVDGT